jgi:predicted nucleotidyltransferase
LRALLPELRENYGVSRLWLFGSVVRGTAGEDSDVDVLVEFEQPGMTLLRFIELEQLLVDRLGVSVDLVTRPALKPAMRDDILAEAIAV